LRAVVAVAVVVLVPVVAVVQVVLKGVLQVRLLERVVAQAHLVQTVLYHFRLKVNPLQLPVVVVVAYCLVLAGLVEQDLALVKVVVQVVVVEAVTKLTVAEVVVAKALVAATLVVVAAVAGVLQVVQQLVHQLQAVPAVKPLTLMAKQLLGLVAIQQEFMGQYHEY